VKQIGRELALRYCAGRQPWRKAANRVRITGQLIDAKRRGASSGPDTFQGTLDESSNCRTDRADVVGNIARRSSSAPRSNGQTHASRKRSNALRLLICAGWPNLHRGNTEANRRSPALFEKAIELERVLSRRLSAWPHGLLFLAQGQRMDWPNPSKRDCRGRRAGAEQGVELGRDDAVALTPLRATRWDLTAISMPALPCSTGL